MAYDDPHRNYLRLKETIQYLQAGGRITEEWMYEHTAHIIKYNEMFEKLSAVNLDTQDSEFRKLAADSEVLLEKLIIAIIEDEWFNLNVYLKLNMNMLRMCDILQMAEDLEACISMLTI